jgi:hypothetical protein
MQRQPDKDRIGLAIRQMIEEMLWMERERIAERVRHMEILSLPVDEEDEGPLDAMHTVLQRLANAIEEDWPDYYPGA